MSKQDIYHSILIVSSSDRFTAMVKKSLHGFITIDCKKSAALARRCILERYYDIVVINAPLSDESGIELAIDTTEHSNASVLFVSPKEVFDDVLENVTDLGIFALSKDSLNAYLDKGIRHLVAVQNRIHKLEQKTIKLEEKLNEIKIVNKAKGYLMDRKGMSEDEAHRHIGKLAMDNGISRKAAAEEILDG